MSEEYKKAVALRRDAEKTNDPAKYFLAALAFEALGMTAAAERCLDRGFEYEFPF